MNDVSKFFIDEDKTVIEAMKALDEVATKVLFVQKDGVLRAALSDGDIRRWILSCGDLNASVRQVANYRPLSLPKCSHEEAIEFMKEKSIEALPIVDDNRRILNIVVWNQKEKTEVKEQISLQSIADELGMDKSYIGRAFRKEFGSGVVEYLIRYRIDKAESLILHGMNVQEASEAVGFMDPSYFGRCFKRLKGYPPKNARKGQ